MSNAPDCPECGVPLAYDAVHHVAWCVGCGYECDPTPDERPYWGGGV